MKAISVLELATWLNDPSAHPLQQTPVLLDVREPWEYQHCHLDGALLVPLQELPEHLDQIDQQRPVVCICHHGIRSRQAALFLKNSGATDIYNLTGGVDAWARQVDQNFPTY